MEKKIEFAKGVHLRGINTPFGDYISVGINLAEFSENDMNSKGFINFSIKKSKSGNYYAQLDYNQGRVCRDDPNFPNFYKEPNF